MHPRATLTVHGRGLLVQRVLELGDRLRRAGTTRCLAVRTNQRPYQRVGRYLPASSRHPGKMLPELARRLVTEYCPPDGLVVDPMCGIGTTLVEAAAVGRRAVGVELELRWAKLARAILVHALPSDGEGDDGVPGDNAQPARMDPRRIVSGTLVLDARAAPAARDLRSAAQRHPSTSAAASR